MLEKIKDMWENYAKKHPKASKWIREGACSSS